ncbi:ABC transporter permease [Hyphomonas sp. UBA5107]|uniref:ABC transporter permease n=1 Tax=Hyphomonas sp. UBA5107 TaxID=1946636 RepID=UPI000C43C2DD|nr:MULTISPECIES: ABC transporter permease [unclassified Hyphomonas]MAA82200.1 hypothetical protein [Hyphomonas sp.]HCN91968.1 hypothetical protein [Hyphomonas sp.]
MNRLSASKDRHAMQSSRHYRPQSRLDATSFDAVSTLTGELSQYRSHISTMFAGDFRSSYRGTVLGVVWNFVLPLVPITVYILLVSLKVFPRYDGLAPAVYISFNVTMWMLLTGMITRPMQVVMSRNQETMKTAMPMSVAITSSFAQLCFDTLVRLALVAALVVAFGQWPQLNIVPFLLSLVTGLAFCLALGLTLAIFNVIYPDVDRITNIVLQYGLFLSGVIFPVATLGPLSVLENLNPFNVFIRTTRDYMFIGADTHPGTLWLWTAVAFIVFLISVRFFYIMEHRIREAV